MSISTAVFDIKTRKQVAAPVADTIDPDSLLTAEDRTEKVPVSCDTQPRACKNCSCGRAEREAVADADAAAVARAGAGGEKVTLPSDASGVDATTVPQSSCGSV
eukprot:TRINITY_DN1660_c0_g1_i2.p2 TRINITY_DN1660_c0_g1~~TRINITY_DN1660_c0_g1_i2.p2  ORF type:complete len:104 (+),score=22.47 TRINITY_DN1660_c0_g1_i2:102-413(+)